MLFERCLPLSRMCYRDDHGTQAKNREPNPVISFRLHGLIRKSARKLATGAPTWEDSENEFGMFYSAGDTLTVILTNEKNEETVEMGACATRR